MADTLIYDIDKIENLYQDFEKVCKNFKNKEYDDFRSSYFYNCSDSVIVKLRNRIQTIYDNIQKGYDMIDKVWKEYIDDVGNFDKSIATGSNVGIHDGGVSSIVSKICSFELYDSAGVSNSLKSLAASGNNIGKSILNALKRTGASIINLTVFAATAGVLKFVEALVDCAILTTGAVKGLYVLAYDGIKSLITGKKDFTNSKKYYNKLLKIVGYDVTGKIKDKFYGTKFGKWFNDNSYAPFKNNGTVYGIGEDIGYVAGIVVLTIFTCGGGTAATAASQAVTTSTQVVSGLIAGAGALGKTAQRGYNKTVDKVVEQAAEKGVQLDRNNVELDGKQMAKIIGNSAAQGAIEGVAFGLTYGGGIKATGVGKKIIEKGGTVLLNPATNVVKKVGKETAEEAIKKSAIELAKKASEIGLKAGIQAGKEYAKAASEEITDIEDHTFADISKKAAISAGISIIYDVSQVGNKALEKGKEIFSPRITKDKIMSKAQETVAQNLDDVAAGSGIGVNSVEALDDYAVTVGDDAYKEAKKTLIESIKKDKPALIAAVKKPLGTAIKNPMKETIKYVEKKLKEEAA